MKSGLKRILNLIAKTGDRLIVSEADFANPYVVMSLEDYEYLVSLEFSEEENFSLGEMSESDLLEKINHDIAIWKAQQKIVPNIAEEVNLENEPIEAAEEDLFLDESMKEDGKDSLEKSETAAKEENKPEDQYYFEPLES
ncbi:MAG: hypothetical protein ACD_12C00414G0001 [uncultured bacterium]|uniref:Uncharacterized protein n=1 Tax=Candidatus Magasanikbacteria bacterium GW2011_GWA2_42_32 TaxID=1619039 RepID=A0A0G1A6Z5_9BACT|nr:MAG: hypothetical protein ACD_12C00414G0001 [uncultured bacterium]KKR48487.1 MAG: hypothetical protein UT86_C0005G0071 [Candidatus Magasanikbacteria bacterium GW2011_GWC2_40_17]KKS56807.1 MAG: hypothetical protein UV20_C0006G0090 [Candidatus Magasanikbacteria bacterium GW2011_GWA2_42_32]OGH86008.1 MAG: hypothetical protein A2294_01945 [Candidatus Magasanikbacteria bacterium RIFOXYB2_FULL_38_10]